MAEYIEREAVNDLIKAECSPKVAAYLIDAVATIPAADVRPARRGRWIPVGTDDMDRGMFRCSECGSEHFFPELLLKIPADNFCSDCGADMREEI